MAAFHGVSCIWVSQVLKWVWDKNLPLLGRNATQVYAESPKMKSKGYSHLKQGFQYLLHSLRVHLFWIPLSLWKNIWHWNYVGKNICMLTYQWMYSLVVLDGYDKTQKKVLPQLWQIKVRLLGEKRTSSRGCWGWIDAFWAPIWPYIGFWLSWLHKSF